MKVNSIAVDAAGNLYLTGFFSEAVDFDPGKGKVDFTAPGSYGENEKKDIFITKFDANGTLLWALQSVVIILILGNTFLLMQAITFTWKAIITETWTLIRAREHFF